MHPALLHSTGWRYTGRARDLVAARWAGVLGQFDDLPKYRRVEVVALYEVSWSIESVNAYEAQERAKRRAKRVKKRA